MKLLREITDKEIIGSSELSNTKPRCTARAILFNDENKFAVMYASRFDFYSLPGGRIEDGEDKIDALKREILEEMGYHCQVISELGYVYENRAHCDFTQYSYYYVAKATGKQENLNLEQDEIDVGICPQWYTLEEVIDLITTPNHHVIQRKFIQAKDTAALNEYINLT